MLSFTDLMSLHRSLHDAHVLSVYVDRSAEDPAAQHAWRGVLEHRFTRLRESLKNSNGDRARFERCVELVGDALATFGPKAGSPGWVAFVTPDGVHDARTLAVGAPTDAMWGIGAWLAPSLRDLKESRPVVVVIGDAKHTTVHLYRNGIVERVDVLRAWHGADNPPMHMGTPSRQNFHSGTRGTTGHDAAQRGDMAARDHMLSDVLERVTHVAGDDAWIVVGGAKQVRAQLREQLDDVAPGRVYEAESIEAHASDTDVADAARTGASSLRDSFDVDRIHEIVDAAGPHGLGAVGIRATTSALEKMCVRDLYLTPRYLGEHAVDAEDAVHAALDQDAKVEQVSGRAAELLDSLGGMAATLRFRPMSSRASAAA
jgi:hypothetical protein